MNDVILYDGDCAFCNWSVGLIKKISTQTYQYIPLHSERAKSLLNKYKSDGKVKDEVVLIKEDAVLGGAIAIQDILLKSDGIWHFFGLILKLIPLKLKDFIYRLIARLRRSKNSCQI